MGSSELELFIIHEDPEVINNFKINLTLEGPCIILCNMCIYSEIHNVVALIKCLLVLSMFEEEAVLPQTLYQLDISAHTIVCTYSIYKEAPEDGPLQSKTCRADT